MSNFCTDTSSIRISELVSIDDINHHWTKRCRADSDLLNSIETEFDGFSELSILKKKLKSNKLSFFLSDNLLFSSLFIYLFVHLFISFSHFLWRFLLCFHFLHLGVPELNESAQLELQNKCDEILEL